MHCKTGQGAALSADAHFGIDQQTMEARAYAVAQDFDPLLVNTVVGFIGPEYFFNGKEIIRAVLEDHFCGKLLGLPMGVDVCYTNHADADGDDKDALLTLFVAAGVNFVITVPGADEIMLNYQSLSHQDAAFERETLRRPPAPEFEAWLRSTSVIDSQGRLSGSQHLLADMAAACCIYSDRGRMSVDETRPPAALAPLDLRRRTSARVLLGAAGAGVPTKAKQRFLLEHARAREAVWTEVDWLQVRGLLEGGGLAVAKVKSPLRDRAEYLSRLDLGRRLSDEARERLERPPKASTSRSS